MTDKRLDRRAFLGLAGLSATGAVLAACSPSSPQWNGAPSPGGSGGPTGPTAGPSQASASPTAASGRPVHVRLYENDGGVYGIGMPIIAYLSATITDSKAFAEATKVTVNGTEAVGAWYFQHSAIYKDYPLEAHYRLQNYWPSHAQIHMDLPVQGLSAGPDLVYDDSLTLDISTGPANVTRVDGSAERMIVTSDDKQVFSFPVSLGKASTPTFNGTKIIMSKAAVERMVGGTGASAYDVKVPWSVRITNSGEFIHSASWNGGNIGRRSTSHGCTNLTEADAKKYFDFAQTGDVSIYVNTGGPTMPSWDGYGDWNLPWSTWQAGGAVTAKS